MDTYNFNMFNWLNLKLNFCNEIAYIETLNRNNESIVILFCFLNHSLLKLNEQNTNNILALLTRHNINKKTPIDSLQINAITRRNVK